MPFRTFLERHYEQVCFEQRRIASDGKMVQMLHSDNLDSEVVRKWMQSYNLFQGYTGLQRQKTIAAFLRFARNARAAPTNRAIQLQNLEAHYRTLLVALYRAAGRSTISAASKLLWSLYPRDVVIYDSFVHRSLVVLQSLDDDLDGFPPVGWTPSIGTGTDAEFDTAVHHYMNYQSMVKRLLERNQAMLDRLRKLHQEVYPYDVRIIDKALWMIGDAKNRMKTLKAPTRAPVRPRGGRARRIAP